MTFTQTLNLHKTKQLLFVFCLLLTLPSAMTVLAFILCVTNIEYLGIYNSCCYYCKGLKGTSKVN